VRPEKSLPDGGVVGGVVDVPTQHWTEESPGQAPAMNEPPEHPFLVFLQVPEPFEVEQLFAGRQH